MSEERFDNALRELTYRKPFIPFVVEFHNGRRLLVTTHAVCFGGGVAGFLSEMDEFVDFAASEVTGFSPVITGAA